MLNTAELIALGVANAREMFSISRKPEWLRVASLYLVAQETKGMQRGKLIARLIKAETDLTAGKEVKL